MGLRMKTKENYLQEFIISLHKDLLEIIIKRELMTKDAAEASIYALHDIAESIEEIYKDIIPKIIENRDNSKEYLNELILELKNEISHILYHIEDAKLYGLKYWDEGEIK